MSILPQETLRTKLQESNRLIGFAVGVDINELLDDARKERDSSGLGDYVAYTVIKKYEREVGPAPVKRSAVLSYGVRDTSLFIGSALRRIPHELSFEQALSILHHPTTVETLALMAMRPADGIDNFDALVSDAGGSYDTLPDHSAIIPIGHIQPSYNGCPAAGDYETRAVKPTPLFRKFTAWSGELALRTFHYTDDSI